MRAQFLRQRRENWDIPVTSALGIGNVDLRRLECQVQVFDPDLNELAHPSTGVEQHLYQEPVMAGTAIGGFDQPFDLVAVQTFHRPAALARRFQTEFTARLFDDMFGLVIIQVMFAPELGCLAGDSPARSSLPAFDRELHGAGNRVCGAACPQDTPRSSQYVHSANNRPWRPSLYT